MIGWRGYGIAVLAAALLGFGEAAAAPRTEITPGEPLAYPESITSTPNGTVIFGSYTKPEIYRSKPGEAVAEPWIALSGHGEMSSFGVLADMRSHTLWVCAVERAPGPPPGLHTLLESFDLASGAAIAAVHLPGDINLCNDIAVAPNGDVYATDTIGGRVLRLDRATKALDVWLADPALRGVDGLTFLRGKLYVNVISTNQVYRVPIGPDGRPGVLVPITLSQPLTRPDGMRAAHGAIFVAENNPGNAVAMLTLDGDHATVTVLKDNLVTPTAVAPSGDTLWVDESRMAYIQDPKLKGQDPGPIKAIAIPMPR